MSTSPRPSSLPPRAALRHLALLALVLMAAGGCSIRKLAVDSLADTLGGSAGVFASDSDPELVREALPFALKTMEALLLESPENGGLLLAACEGFTGYTAAFLEPEAERLAFSDYRAAAALEERARGLYLRARDYCLRALELTYPGIGAGLLRTPEEAVERTRAADARLLFWTGASWGAAIAVSLDRPEVVVDLPAARALVERALELDPDYGRGILHEAMISIEALPESMGGSLERAREHFERAVELSQVGRPPESAKAGPYLTWAVKVSLQRQDREEFESMLRRALEVDPELLPESRVANLVAQRRAAFLLERADELILDDVEDTLQENR